VLLVLGTQAAWPETYVSTDVPKTGNPLFSEIVVPDNRIIEKVTVTIEDMEALQSIPYMGTTELNVELQSPNNTRANLLNYNTHTCIETFCNFEHHFHNATFDDETGVASYTGYYFPLIDTVSFTRDRSLRNIQGEKSGGTWTLNVSMPYAPSETATLSGWHLTLSLQDEVCIENPEGCVVPSNGIYEAGGELCLFVPCPVASDSTFAWTKDGEPLTRDIRVSGVNVRTLRILSLEKSDSGLYSCAYNDGTKVIQEYEVKVTVVTEMPALGPLGIIVLTTVCGALGVFTRRKRL
jgi:subtilisin-like proprotein convertase family protein